MRTPIKAMAMAAVLGIGLLGPVATPASAVEWHWSVTPYIWGAAVTMDLEANDEPVTGVDVSFNEIIDKTDLAFMGRFEGRAGKIGFLVDTLFLGVSDESTSASDSALPSGTETSTDLDTWIHEAAGFWRPSGKDRGFDLLFGARLLDLDLEVDVALPSPSTTETELNSSKSYLDGFIGGRYSQPMSKRTDISVRGDVGAGASELVWNAIVTFGVAFDDDGDYVLRLGYRHMQYELEDDDSTDDVTVETDQLFAGPFIGFTFAWGTGA